MSGKHQPVQVPDYTGVNLQTASMSVPVPLAWGMSRGAPNLIDYVGFQVHKKTVGKGGSFFGKSTQYSYSASIVLALCEGPIAGIGEIYVNQGETTGLSQFGFTLFTGTTPQAPWSYMSANFPTHALSYQGVAYLAAANYNLGPSEAIPNHGFEVKAPLYNTGYTASGGDADCALVVQDFLTNSQYGAYFPTARLDLTALLSGPNATTTGDSAFQTYCRAMGFGLSPFYQTRESAISILSRLCQCTNTAPVWTGYSLKLIPFGDVAVAGHGVTWLPPTGSVFAFTDDDYMQDADKDPVEMARADWFDAYNRLVLEIRDRGYMYNTVPIDVVDLGAQQLLGPREAPTVQAHEICDKQMGQTVAQLIDQRIVNVRNSFTFKVGPEHSLIEPMDCGTITETGVLGLAALAVRVRSVEELEDGTFEVVVEEFPGATGSPASVAVTGGGASPINSQVAPQSVNTPIIFEPPSPACAFLNNGSAAPLVVALVSAGPGGTFDPNWGGCVVNVSTDGSTYVPLANLAGSDRIAAPAAMGPLTANLPGFGAANPDTADTLAVNLSQSNGTLSSASSGATAAAGATLGVIQDSFAAPVELIGPETATLTSAGHYSLTTLYRGLFGSPAGAHATSALYGRLDQAAFIAALPAAYIGVTLYFKFQSFNLFGNALQDLSTCTVYTYTPAGTGFGTGSGGVPGTPTGLAAATTSPQAVALSWSANPAADNVTAYKLFRATGSGASFGSASLVATVSGSTLNYTDAGLTGGGAYTYFLEAANAVGASAPTAGVNATAGGAAAGGSTTSATVNQSGGLAAGQVCFLYDNAGSANVELASAADATKPANCFVLASYANSAAATVYLAGQFATGLSGLSPGATYWLSTTGGAITTTAPAAGSGNLQQEVGVADSTGTKLFFNPKTGVLV